MKKSLFKNKKTGFIIAICLLIVACATVSTFAYLIDSTAPISNEFVPAKVTCEVEETFENGVKENVCVKNTGNIDAFIRASVVVDFVSDDNKILATAPLENVNYSVVWGADWQKGKDGYWYYKKAIAPDKMTTPLINTATEIFAPYGYRLNIQIIASAVQSTPESAVKDAWGISLTNGELIPD